MCNNSQLKLNELSNALIAHGLVLRHVFRTEYTLMGGRCELILDINCFTSTYSVTAESLQRGSIVIVRWIDKEKRWLVLTSKQYLKSHGSSKALATWAAGNPWSTKVKSETRTFLFDTQGAAQRLAAIGSPLAPTVAHSEPITGDLVSSLPSDREISLDAASAHLKPAQPGKRATVYKCDLCLQSPPVSEILEGPIPVPSFGCPAAADVLTIGLNPSRTEFYPLDPSKKRIESPHPATSRLPLLSDYAVQTRTDLDATQLNDIELKQESYFQRANTHKWFDSWRVLLQEASPDWSYASKTAAHADLVACTTDPTWGGIKQRNTKLRLLSNCHSHFAHTLEQLHGDCWTLWDGRSTWQTLDKLLLSECRREQYTGSVLQAERPTNDSFPDEERGLFNTDGRWIEWRRGHLTLRSGKRLRYLAWDQFVNRKMTDREKQQLGRLVF